MYKKYTFHILGLAHLPTSKNYLSCAFTQKIIKQAHMLADLGHTVRIYGCIGDYGLHKNITFVETHTIDDIRSDYGDGDNRYELGYNWHAGDFRHDFNTDKRKSTIKYYARAIQEINTVKKPDDFLVITQGVYQKTISDAVGLFLTVESGVGYRGSFARFRAFESAYLQNFTYGSEHPYESIDGNHYDRVIPNYFEPTDIEFSDQKDDYYLFIGRMIKRKGIIIAHLTAQARKKKLIIAGQGGLVLPDGSLTATVDPDFIIPKGNWEYVGYADLETRKKLMAHAKVTLVPTEYLEAFAGVHIESMLSGTPVVTTNFGVFGGTVIDGVNGYKANTLQDFVDCAREAEDMNPHKVRASATKYLTHSVKHQYQKWYDDLYKVWESTQDDKIKAWHRLDE